MDNNILFGSLVLHAERPVSSLELLELHTCIASEGHHVRGRHNGKWREANSNKPLEIYLPQRYKRMLLSASTTDGLSLRMLEVRLAELDSKYPGARQLYKLNQLLADYQEACPEDAFAAAVNISSTGSEDEPVSGSFYLLSLGAPMFVALVFDTAENSVQLVWSTLDFKSLIQSRSQHRYLFYPFQTMCSRPLFLNTQTLCARWWKFMRTFGDGRLALLKAANALEVLLYKDPNLPNYKD